MIPETKTGPRVSVLIVAGGRGSRAVTADDDSPKQYRNLDGLPVITRTIEAFLVHPAITQIVAVIHRDDQDAFRDAAGMVSAEIDAVVGGETRQQSVYNGLEFLAAIQSPPDIVLIHDAVRPFISAGAITRVLNALQDADAAIAALPVVDTLKSSTRDGTVEATIPRDGLWRAQTPQGFRFEPILNAHRTAAQHGRSDFTDDAAVAEWQGIDVNLVEGNPENIKLTTAEDLADADRRLLMEKVMSLTDIRVGTGYDVHGFEAGNSVTLCGIEIAHDRSLRGHSDADVAMHALTDALFGAIGAGDIGSHFPPSDPQWRGAASSVFLQRAVSLIREHGGLIASVDVTIICEAPKVGPHRDAMRANLAELCGIDVTRVSVKATTTEKLGFTGRREGIAAMATATVRLPM